MSNKTAYRNLLLLGAWFALSISVQAQKGFVLNADQFKHYANYFNGMEDENNQTGYT